MVEGDSPWDYVNWEKAKKSLAKLLIKKDLDKLINVDLESHGFQWQAQLGDGSDTNVYTGIIESKKTPTWVENNNVNDLIWPVVGEIRKGYVEVPYESSQKIIPEQVIEAARFNEFLESLKIPYREKPNREQTMERLEKLLQIKVRELSLLLDKSKEIPYKPENRKKPTPELLQRQKAGRISACIEAKWLCMEKNISKGETIKRN